MSGKYDVVALGELLIDFTENGMSEQGNPIMEANPGGAPCNVLAMLSKLGKKTSFIGMVGNDIFGNKLQKTLEEVGIGTEGLIKSDEFNTTLAFVHTLKGGDREFSFYRKPGADMMLSENDINLDLIRNTKIFHFGTLSMTDSICRDATHKAIEEAKNSGALLSFDPNLREPLWPSLDLAKEMITYGLSKCDILKISDNEALWYAETDSYDDAISYIKQEFPNIKLILLSLGKEGSRAYLGDIKVEVPAVITDKTIETTGAGDTFCGVVLSYVLDNGLDLTSSQIEEMLRKANKAASIITTRKGALRVMPDAKEIE